MDALDLSHVRSLSRIHRESEHGRRVHFLHLFLLLFARPWGSTPSSASSTSCISTATTAGGSSPRWRWWAMVGWVRPTTATGQGGLLTTWAEGSVSRPGFTRLLWVRGRERGEGERKRERKRKRERERERERERLRDWLMGDDPLPKLQTTT